MKTTDEIIELAERVAKSRVKHMKAPRFEKQKVASTMRTSYVEGYAQAIRDFKAESYLLNISDIHKSATLEVVQS